MRSPSRASARNIGRVIYRWDDGSVATIEALAPADDTLRVHGIVVQLCRHGRFGPDRVRLQIFPKVHAGLQISSQKPQVIERIDGVLRRKLLGLCLDLGLGMPRTGTASGLLGCDSSRKYLPCPRFVPDDRFAERYEEALQTWGAVDPPFSVSPLFLGRVDGVRFQKKRDGFVAHWHHDNLPPRNQARVFATDSGVQPTLEAAVDVLVEKNDLRPVSEEVGWWSENAELGNFVLPERDEIELYLLLGEGLPYFWPTDRLVAWLAERMPVD